MEGRVYRIELENKQKERIVLGYTQETSFKGLREELSEKYKGQGWIKIYFKTGKYIQYGFPV